LTVKIALIMPKAAVKGMPYDTPIGIGSISAVLKRAGHEVWILNLNHHEFDTPEQIIERIRSFNPDVIGTGGMSFSYLQLKNYIGMARHACPDVNDAVFVRFQHGVHRIFRSHDVPGCRVREWGALSTPSLSV